MSDSSRMDAYYRKAPRTAYGGLEAVQEALEERERQYQAALQGNCPHGRIRASHGHGVDLVAGYECSQGKCGFRAITPDQMASEWKSAVP